MSALTGKKWRSPFTCLCRVTIVERCDQPKNIQHIMAGRLAAIWNAFDCSLDDAEHLARRTWRMKDERRSQLAGSFTLTLRELQDQRDGDAWMYRQIKFDHGEAAARNYLKAKRRGRETGPRPLPMLMYTDTNQRTEQ